MFSRELQYFLAVSECLNFTTAARNLYVSQPTLSKTISNLEKDLKVSLFVRSTRSVRLTSEGEEFLAITKQFMRQINKLSREHSAEDDATHTLTIGIGDFGEAFYIHEIVRRFTASYPQYPLVIKRFNPKELVVALDRGDVTASVMTAFSTPEKGYHTKVYYPSPHTLVVSPSHPLAHRERVHISELIQEDFIIIQLNQTSPINNHIQTMCAQEGFAPKIKLETDSLTTLFMLIAAGAGIGVLPLLHKPICTHDLRFIPLDITENSEGYSNGGGTLVWKTEGESVALHAFLDCAINCIKQISPPSGGLT